MIAVPIIEGYYGAGAGPILIDELNCTGSESNLDQCGMRTFGETNCEHREDAGVMCLSKYKLLFVYFGRPVPCVITPNVKLKSIFDLAEEDAEYMLVFDKLARFLQAQ